MDSEDFSAYRRGVRFSVPHILIGKRHDGSLLVKSADELGHFSRCLGDLLVHWAGVDPERVFLAERTTDGKSWIRVTYREALERVRRIGSALIDRGLSRDRPVMILSGNSIRHALLSLASMHVGIPVAPISPFYALCSSDFSKLKHVYGLLSPGLLFIEQLGTFKQAFQALPKGEFELVSCGDVPDGVSSTAFDVLEKSSPSEPADKAFRSLNGDTVAKILFTSASTGMPKGVINTQRMLCSNQRAILQCWPFLAEKPPVVLDWLPWNHTFGANHNFNMILQNGGTLYIDGGKPTAEKIRETVRNICDVSSTIYFNVPRGYDMLLSFLEKDRSLAKCFLRSLDVLFYAAAPLPPNIWKRLKDLSNECLGYEVPLVSAWGSTETSPTVTCIHFPITESDNIGLPVPGSELLMVQNCGKLELRARGPNVTPGYWRQPELDSEAFDDEGFFRIGDAGKWIDESNPERGIRFDGRITEDFKISTGTWVSVNAVRLRLVAAMNPLVQDAVITGHGSDYLGALLFVSPHACKAIIDDSAASCEWPEILKRRKLRSFVESRMAALEKESGASSLCIRRILLMAEAPSADTNEITDKGYINQRAVLEHRRSSVERLYADPPDADVISLPSGSLRSGQ